jgi:hypothetical protein
MTSDLFKQIVLAIACVLIVLLFVEGGMRGYHAWVKRRSPYVGDPELTFLHRKYTRPATERPPGVQRLIVLGDSVTDGYGVEKSERYQDRLAALLEREGERYEVITLAMPQYSTPQEVALFERVGVPLEPDWLVLGYVLNDPIADGSINSFFRRDRAASLLLHWASARLARISPESKQMEGCEQFDYYSHSHCDRDLWGAVQDAFRRLEVLSRRDGFRVLVAIFPLLERDPAASFSTYPWTSVNAQVAREVGSHGFEVLDLLPAFSSRTPAELKLNKGDVLHPNGLGHRIAAEAIFAGIHGKPVP